MSVVETASREGDQTPSGVSRSEMANAIRALAMDAVEQATCGHPGMPMGMADVATVLFSQFLKYDPAAPDWPDRDRFVLSAGHGSMLLYALLYLTGYEDMTIEQIKAFRQWGSRTAGHPEYGEAPGIETTTGPLGQGLANGVGMALGERLLNARFGDHLVDHCTYVLAGDGCLMEGISHEAISLAGHLRLGRLIVLFDDNGISIDGPTDMAVSDDQAARFAASGWHVQAVDGHDQSAVADAIAAAQESDLPSLICCRTTIGYGAPNKQGTAAVHGAKLGAEEVAAARRTLGWTHDPFEIPDEVLSHWRAVGARGREQREQWQQRLSAASDRAAFERLVAGELPDGWRPALDAHKRALAEERPKRPTRKSSGEVLEVLTKAIPELVGGSADLTGSNNTRVKDHRDVGAGDFAGGYVRYGVREHGMAAAMNGLALHGGLIPYGATFLVFTDYARPAIRLSALMGIRVIYVMTHDSIGLGEDGPTHQPVEHLASLRAMPNVNVLRPADAVETAECWALAIESTAGPSVIALTRQDVPTVRISHSDDNLCARGAYVLAGGNGQTRDVTLLATGSEVAVALEARDILAESGKTAAVVSMPCWEQFDRQDEAYRREVLGDAPRVAVEAAVGLGWERYTGPDGAFVGMTGFGASAPAATLFEEFGITAARVAAAARDLIDGN